MDQWKDQSMEGSVVRQEAMVIGPRSVEAYVGDNPLSILSFFCCNVMRMGQEMNLDCNRKDARTAGEICVAFGFPLDNDRLALLTIHQSNKSTVPAV